ncbi:MAG TPA: ImmA/IrrE family metallo-endopeptidase [Solirubrobacterales bacterium]|jgi:hypothetical protein|nr:ImmA/IrrE family metallo-endopeptidase [Solirubrobacterales bacterium]
MNSETDSVDKLAAWVLRQTGTTKTPVPVDRLALRLGVDRIVRKPLDGDDGRVGVLDGRLVVWVRPDAPLVRRRFTVAHEIGHLLLADPSLDQRAIRRARGSDTEERFCDRFAEALLMPADRLRAMYSDQPQDLDTLQRCAALFQVSQAAALLRLRSCLGWSRSLLRWTATREGMSLASVTGWEPEPRATVRSASATRDVVELALGDRSGKAVWLPLSVQGEEIEVRTELAPARSGGVALVDLSRRRFAVPPTPSPARRTVLSPRLKPTRPVRIA